MLLLGKDRSLDSPFSFCWQSREGKWCLITARWDGNLGSSFSSADCSFWWSFAVVVWILSVFSILLGYPFASLLAKERIFGGPSFFLICYIIFKSVCCFQRQTIVILSGSELESIDQNGMNLYNLESSNLWK